MIFNGFDPALAVTARRYVHVAAASRWRAVPRTSAVRSGCFCTRGAMQDYAVISLLSRWQKPPMDRGGL